MEVEQTETQETTEAVVPETTEAPLDDLSQAQINEWLEDKGKVLEEETEEIQEEEAEPEPLAAEAETEETEETPRVSKAFSKVAKKERDIQQQRHALKKEKEALKPILEAKQRIDKGDMIGALESISWTYEDATNQVLQDGKLQAPKTAENKLTPEVEERLAKLETMERQKQVDSYVKRLENTVKNDERFELVRDNWENAFPTILEMQKIVANETGTIKQDEEILLEVEEFYEQQAQKLAKSGKFKNLLQPVAGKPEKTTESPRTKKTLRNKVTASQPADKGEPKSRRERLEAALATYGSSL